MDSSYAVKYLAEKSRLESFGDSPDRITKTLYNSKISLNPHQIQAALFAFASPVTKGVMLCDEVGLGKTIEAGIVVSQYWCERKRHILIITPASLTRQWASELSEKFAIPTDILDRKNYTKTKRKGIINPFEQKDKVLIMSLNFASMMADEIQKSKIDLVVIDEAHKLRNVHNATNITSNNILRATGGFKKILLTATPLQNNLMELFGLSMLIDPNIFGDKHYFKKHYNENNIDELRGRLKSFVHRTLRAQVKKYVKYSKRVTETFNFVPSKDEDALYDSITELIQSEPSLGIKRSQTTFVSLILRKLLSSSTSAVTQTLKTIKTRIEKILAGEEVDEADDIFKGDELVDFEDDTSSDDVKDDENKFDFVKLRYELDHINKSLDIASKIKDDKKAFKLLDAINFLFSKADENRRKKILIFTESAVTQKYLYNFLNENGFNKVVLFNGGNTDPNAKTIYENWAAKPENAELLKNSRSTNIRTALLDYFESDAEIMIATEAGAEGLNIQFCSMLVNYDLPWNPQRVEQRIGRCHRFGQKNDVIVINFLNTHNQIDGRIYELLASKFKLFDNVFGASDEILGKLDSETNFEREIFNIYAQCRSPKEINDAFDQLQEKYKYDINAEMKRTREMLIDNFDEDLQQVFESLLEDTELKIQEIEALFWRLCQYALQGHAKFGTYSFDTTDSYLEKEKKTYVVVNKDRERINLHIDDEIGTKIVSDCLNTKLAPSADFDITNYRYKIKEIQDLKGKTGILNLSKVKISSFENEEYLILTGRLSDGTFLERDVCEKLFRISSCDSDVTIKIPQEVTNSLMNDVKAQVDSTVTQSMNRNNGILQSEITRIDKWANDKISGIELKVEMLREQRKNLQKDYDYSSNSEEKVKIEAEINKISKQIKSSWLELADNEDLVEAERKKIVDKLKAQNMKTVETTNIFNMNFRVI